jgi:DNA mismatch repair ATPase MutS
MEEETFENLREEIGKIIDDENIDQLTVKEPEVNEEDYIVKEILKNLLSKELLEEPLKSLKNEIKNSNKECNKEAYKIINEIEELLSKENQDTENLIKLLDQVTIV